MQRIEEVDENTISEGFVARKVVIKKGKDMKNYLFSGELHRGHFGTVFKCTEKTTGLELAAKFISTRNSEERENVQREVNIMIILQHKRLLQLYDVYDNGHSLVCMITEIISERDLFERVIDDNFELTEKISADFIRQICEGVGFMHQNSIMHLDLKPENVMCVAGDRIKLINFSSARKYDPNMDVRVRFNSPDFAAPEVLGYKRITPAADMWSIGVICYVLLSGLPLFIGKIDLETMVNITKGSYNFDDEVFDSVSDEAKDFISKLLIKDAHFRLKFNECSSHRWLATTSAKYCEKINLSKTKLKKYVVKRRWQKFVTAIISLKRIGVDF